MEEIEILVKLDEEKEKVISKLKNFKKIGTKKVLDVYFYDPKRKNLKQDKYGKIKECFRIRKKEDKNYVAYKLDYFEGKKWSHSDEHETAIENFETFEKIVKNLGFKELVKIDNEKQIYETENFEIVLEDVIGLGLFLEVENKNLKGNVKEIKEKIMKFIESLNLKFEEMNEGKPELMLKKINKN